MKAYKGTFTANTATGNQTVSGIVDEDGNAFTPKAVILWTSYVTTTGFIDGWTWGCGVTDGADQFSAGGWADDNAAAQQAACLSSAASMARITAGAAATAVRIGTFVSFGSGQFVINWTTVDAVAAIFHFVALGGDDLSVDMAAGGANGGVSQGRAANIAAILPRAIFGLYGHASISAAIGPSYGVWALEDDYAISQGAGYAAVDDNQNPSICKAIQRNDLFCLTPSVAGVGVLNAYGVDHVGAFYNAMNLSDASTAGWLIIGGINAKAGSGLQPTSAGAQAVSGLGFSPKVVFLFNIGQTAIANTTVAAGAKMSVGAADRSRQGYAYVGANDAVTPSVSVSKSDGSNVIVSATPNATAASTTTQAEAAVQSIDSDGFTLDWTSADATQRQYNWLALGDLPSAGGGGAHAAAHFGGI